jgi:small-conductance mechanosensitive channel
MSAVDVAIPFADFSRDVSEFWDGNKAWISAVLAIVLAVTAAFVVDRWFVRRGRELAGRVLSGGISQQADTRLRFVRRLVWLTILLLGVMVALSQFTGISRLAASVLASGALAAAIIGFAARQTLANLVAGIMLAISQPLRVGDWVTFEDHYGVVEDIRLNFTVLRTLAEQRIVIPNEMLASGILRNDTLETDAVGLDVEIWLPPEADADRALTALREETGQTVTVAEVTVEGVRLAVGGERVPPPERPRREAELRATCLKRLRADGLLATATPPSAASPA